MQLKIEKKKQITFVQSSAVWFCSFRAFARYIHVQCIWQFLSCGKCEVSDVKWGIDSLCCMTSLSSCPACPISTIYDADGVGTESSSVSHEESFSPAAENPLRKMLQVLHFHIASVTLDNKNIITAQVNPKHPAWYSRYSCTIETCLMNSKEMCLKCWNVLFWKLCV